MSNNSDELSEFIESTIAGIKKGTDGKGFCIFGPIKFDVAIAKIKEGSGGFKIHVVNAGSSYKAEEITKIQFEIKPFDEGLAQRNRQFLQQVQSEDESLA